MLGGQPDQTEHHKEDNWSSSQTPSCCKESNMSPIPCHSSRLQRVARSPPAAETQAAYGDDNAVCARLCLKEIQFGQLDLQKWQTEAKQIPACLVVDCRGVYDVVARSSFSCLGLNENNLAWKRLLSKKILLNVARWYVRVILLLQSWVTLRRKTLMKHAAPWELLVRRGFRWKLIHDHKLESSPNRAKRGLDIFG